MNFSNQISIIHQRQDLSEVNLELNTFYNLGSKLDLSYFPRPWSENAWAETLSNHQNYMMFLVLGSNQNVPLGMCLFSLNGTEEAHLLKILVVPNQRQLGIGEQLAKFSFQTLRKMGLRSFFLEVELDNLAAMALYQKLGFRVIRQNKNYYGVGKDALSMMMP